MPERRDAQLEVMADLLAAHLDLEALLALLDAPVPAVPVITSMLRPLPECPCGQQWWR